MRDPDATYEISSTDRSAVSIDALKVSDADLAVINAYFDSNPHFTFDVLGANGINDVSGLKELADSFSKSYLAFVAMLPARLKSYLPAKFSDLLQELPSDADLDFYFKDSLGNDEVLINKIRGRFNTFIAAAEFVVATASELTNTD